MLARNGSVSCAFLYVSIGYAFAGWIVEVVNERRMKASCLQDPNEPDVVV